jgi:transposase InsO family protein
MARDNPSWGQARIANELLVKLEIQVSPRTIQKYLLKDPNGGRKRPDTSQRWMNFVRNHGQAMLACDFLVTVTARFQILYVFVIMEIRTRRLVHFNATTHPNAAWTLQQFRQAIGDTQGYRFLIHDRDSIYAQEMDLGVKVMGVKVLKTPFRSPQANSYGERLVGTMRRECLDYLIPIGESHLRKTLNVWKAHYNQARPHSSLGPGLPEPGHSSPVPIQKQRHQLQEGCRVKSKTILGGLHHEYWLEKIAA